MLPTTPTTPTTPATANLTPADAATLADPSLLRRINYRVSRLRRKYALSAEDAKDLRQDFLLVLLRAQCRYDPSKCPFGRYVSMVLNRRYKHHVRRLARADEVQDVVSVEEVEPEHLEALIEPSAERRLRQFEAREDVQTVLDSLPEKDRELCEILKVHSRFEAAKLLGLHHTTIYRRMARLRQRFIEAGLGDGF